MHNDEKCFNALSDRALPEDPKALKADAESIVRDILLELGAPEHLVGHEYAIFGILLAVENRMYINSMSKLLYPKIAVKFDATAANVERAVRHLIEVIWERGDPDTLFRYFGNTISAKRSRPTNGEFFARIANIVRMRMPRGADMDEKTAKRYPSIIKANGLNPVFYDVLCELESVIVVKNRINGRILVLDKRG